MYTNTINCHLIQNLDWYIGSKGGIKQIKIIYFQKEELKKKQTFYSVAFFIEKKAQ